MANKLNFEMAGSKSPRQRIWETIRHQADGFTVASLCQRCKVEIAVVEPYVSALGKAGIIVTLSSEKAFCVTRHTYGLVDDRGLEAPRINQFGKEITRGQGNDAMWGTLRRVLRHQPFTYRELAAFASTSTHIVKVKTAKEYVQTLYHAGYLRCDVKARRGNGAQPAKYSLIATMDSGPRAPRVQSCKTVFDANWDRVVWEQKTGDDDGEM